MVNTISKDLRDPRRSRRTGIIVALLLCTSVAAGAFCSAGSVSTAGTDDKAPSIELRIYLPAAGVPAAVSTRAIIELNNLTSTSVLVRSPAPCFNATVSGPTSVPALPKEGASVCVWVKSESAEPFSFIYSTDIKFARKAVAPNCVEAIPVELHPLPPGKAQVMAEVVDSSGIRYATPWITFEVLPGIEWTTASERLRIRGSTNEERE